MAADRGGAKPTPKQAKHMLRQQRQKQKKKDYRAAAVLVRQSFLGAEKQQSPADSCEASLTSSSSVPPNQREREPAAMPLCRMMTEDWLESSCDWHWAWSRAQGGMQLAEHVPAGARRAWTETASDFLNHVPPHESSSGHVLVHAEPVLSPEDPPTNNPQELSPPERMVCEQLERQGTLHSLERLNTDLDSFFVARDVIYQCQRPAPLPAVRTTNPDTLPSSSDEEAAEPRASRELSGSPTPQMLTRMLSLGKCCFRIHWSVDARKLHSNAKSIVSPLFDMSFGEDYPNVPFKMIIYAASFGTGKGEGCFKGSAGKGSIHIKCEGAAPCDSPIQLRLLVGGLARGPIVCDFAHSSMHGLPEDQALWDFSAAITDVSTTFGIILEVVPNASRQDGGIERGVSESHHASPLKTMRRCDIHPLFHCGNVFSAYTIGNVIGQGAFGRVFEARHNTLRIPRAVKKISRSSGDYSVLRNELASLLVLDHPHIVKLVEYCAEEHDIYLIFELCRGPDLFDAIVNAPHGRLSEHNAALALRHILKALQCCHARYRGHYDIKPENFMYTSVDLSTLKMIDLGLSSGFNWHDKCKMQGTSAYMAPEIWNAIYGPEGDVWSCGIVLFVMLTGENFLNLPPDTLMSGVKVRAEVKNRIQKASEKYGLSADAQDLLGMMLQHDRHGRPTVREALNHPFSKASYVREKLSNGVEQRHVQEAAELLRQLPDIVRAIGKEPMLKRVARLVMGHVGEFSEASRMAFRMLDWHGYGELSVSVLEDHFLRSGVDVPSDIDALFEVMDTNGDGYISFTTFLSTFMSRSELTSETLMKVAFNILDRDKDGFITAPDLAAIFSCEGEIKICQHVLTDLHPDGRISWEDFECVMTADEGNAS